MSILQEMLDMLSPLGIYSLRSDTLVYKELTVYANAFQKLHSYLGTVLREAFIITGEDVGLTLREQLFGGDRPDLSAQQRRERLLGFFSLRGDDFTSEDIEEQFLMYGLSNPFSADPQTETFSLLSLPETDDPVELSDYYKTVEEIAPAHLFPDVGIGEIDWDSIDGFNHTFWQWDEAGIRFDMFE